MVLGGSRCISLPHPPPPGRERCPLVVPEPQLSRVAASHLLNATWGDWSFSARCWEDRWRGHGTFWRADGNYEPVAEPVASAGNSPERSRSSGMGVVCPLAAQHAVALRGELMLGPPLLHISPSSRQWVCVRTCFCHSQEKLNSSDVFQVLLISYRNWWKLQMQIIFV